MHTHSDRLERWLGAEQVARVSDAMRGWYGPPIAVHGVPGAVFATRDGDFIGEIRAGQEVGAFDVAQAALQRFNRAQRAKVAQHKVWHRQGRGLAAGNRQAHAFSSLSALISAATGGKKQDLTFQKTGVAANAAGNCIDLWAQGSQPAAGAAGGAAPTVTTNTSATTGALPFANPGNANTLHFVTGYVTANVAANTLLLYDRLFAVAKTMNSTATEAVSGTFTRYQSAVATDANYVGGNFVFPSSPTTVLPATAHNWTVCQYTNQSGVVGQSIPSIAGVSACVAGGVDLLAGRWFMPLSAGDVGVKALTQMQCSALVATGTIDFVVGHPIAFFPCPVANMVCIVDGINTAFNLTTVFDNACLAFLEMPKPATTAASYSGIISAVAE